MNNMQKNSELFSVQGKSALVTGATGYLGSRIAYTLAKEGAHVLVNSRSRARANEQVKKIVDSGYSAEPAIFDLTNKLEIEDFFSKRFRQSLHILVNNAYSGNAGNIESSSDNDYVSSYHITLVAAHNLLRTALPELRNAVAQDGDASVINISSMYGTVSPDQSMYRSKENINPPYYGAAKAALIQWTRYAACEFGREGIRVNALSPGPFPSDLTREENPIFIEKLSKKVPLGRVGRSEEILGPVLFLASSAASFVNGSNIIVDGGWTAW